MMSKNKIINTLEHCINDRCNQCPIGYKDGRVTCPQFENCYREIPETVLLDALKMLKQPQWVSVKDGLPPKLTLVLVCNHGIYDIAFVGDRGNWVNKLFEPEYWMPLPEPPKEVTV